MKPDAVYDVMCMGRVGVDVYPVQIGVPLEDVTTFGKFLGGSAANVAVATARLGHSVGLISKTGADPFGSFVNRELSRLKVDPRFVGVDQDQPTPVTFCEIFPPDRFPLYFYRGPTTPDLTLDVDEVPLEQVQTARVFWVTLTGLSCEPSRRAHMAALQARSAAAAGPVAPPAPGQAALETEPAMGQSWTVLDLDFRPSFWRGGEAEAKEQASRALQHCNVAVGNVEECRVATGETEPAAAAAKLLDLGVQLAVVKVGPDGALAATRTRTWRVPGYRVKVVNGLGAGDGFGGALCHGLLSGWPMARVLQFANAAGAYVTTHIDCSGAMPTQAQVLDLIDRLETSA